MYQHSENYRRLTLEYIVDIQKDADINKPFSQWLAAIVRKSEEYQLARAEVLVISKGSF
ncbi:MAG: hypothetical protein U5R06_02395 [candidate division KSB1 bacterium]|nr:hypothetical protein [candidate division KSB1 bacterium]